MSEYKNGAAADEAAAEKEENRIEDTAVATAEKDDQVVADEDEDNDYIIKFKKPFKWEGNTYNEIDLSGMEDLSARDMIQVQREMQRAGGGVVDTMPEITVEYACIFAAKATDMPQEFFQALPAREAIKIKNKVMNFFYGTD